MRLETPSTRFRMLLRPAKAPVLLPSSMTFPLFQVIVFLLAATIQNIIPPADCQGSNMFCAKPFPAFSHFSAQGKLPHPRS
ncbi:MAG: hypothetical protein IKD61_04135, partial [Oscillospiraceae bacterium]|nr:hypothetical protein [Oscillospiraceae bacterium]